jgi:hypothetical protein
VFFSDSGDDHDYCEYVHVTKDGKKVREVTVKSFSMAMGIRRPGFQLLSLSGAVALPSVADAPCTLPDQIRIYVALYVPCIILSLLALLAYNVLRVRDTITSHKDNRDITGGTPLPLFAFANTLGPRSSRSPVRLWSSTSGTRTFARRNVGVLHGFVLDVWDVAWPAITLFMLITFWAFW